jgi:hypothetical protein
MVLSVNGFKITSVYCLLNITNYNVLKTLTVC